MDPVIPAGLQSENVYHFRNMEQANNILHSLAFYNNRFRHSVIWYPGDKFLGVWDGMTYTFLRVSNATLGTLERLPLHVLYMILENIDIKSLIEFRQLSLKARHIVNSIPHGKYQRVIEHAYILLRALFQTPTELATKVSLVDLDTALCTVACSICGEFSGFISIPTWKRCCFSCLQRAPELRMESLAEAKRDFGLTKSQLGQLDLFYALPGKYTMQGKGHTGYNHAMVSIHQAAIISGRPPPPVPSWKLYSKENYMASCPLPFYDRRSNTRGVESGLSCLGCNFAYSQNKEVSTIEKWVTAEKLYTTDGFLRHFQRCAQAQRLWEMIEAGGKLPYKPLEERQAGVEEPREDRYQY